LAAFGGGALIALAWTDMHDANAGIRSRRARRRRHRRQIIAPNPEPITCDPAAPSGIAGLVLIGPMCPVMQIDVPCPDRPYATTLVARDGQGLVVCSFESGADGRFRVGLPPGEYELGPEPSEFDRLPYASPQPVTVWPWRYTEVLVSFDSGIR
jgi:hypothetical protein